jgi:hypothetical protein
MQKMLSAKFGLPPAEVKCKGCRGQKGERLVFPLCETYKCASGRDIEFCFECREFPCSKLQPASEGAEKYPHNIKLFNLCRIKAAGLEEWAKEAPDIRKRYFKGKFVIGLGPVVE